MTAPGRTFTLRAAMFALQGLSLAAMGHPWICTCGTVKLWHGEVFSSENSQHLTDWYTFGHVNHGLLFYGLFWLIARRRSLDWRLLAVGLTGVIWEVGENTDLVINRFRAVTISLDYYGDSVINSVFDSLFMVLGVLIAARVPGLGDGCPGPGNRGADDRGRARRAGAEHADASLPDRGGEGLADGGLDRLGGQAAGLHWRRPRGMAKRAARPEVRRGPTPPCFG